MAPLVRRALELLPEGGGPELVELVGSRLPAALAPRLEVSGLSTTGEPPAGPGSSALLTVSGPGVGAARLGVLLHPDGSAYTVALRAEGRALPPELTGAEAGLDAAPPELPEPDRRGREWAAAALATLTRPAAELVDDHRWWGDLGALIMLADLLVEMPESG